jgi:hypothetical protein
MNRKHFLILIILVVVLGGAGLVLWQRDSASWGEAGARVGQKLLSKFDVDAVAKIRLQGGGHTATVVKQDKQWVVAERNDYPADVSKISSLLLTLSDLKVVQGQSVASDLLPRLDLVRPGGEPEKKASAAGHTGTLVEFDDKDGKLLAQVLLGKKFLKQDAGSPPGGAGTPAGRYVLTGNDQSDVLLVANALDAAVAEPAQWLDKRFFRIERAKSITVDPANGGKPWQLTRTTEDQPWQLTPLAKDEKLDAGKAGSLSDSLNALTFDDVATSPGTQWQDKATAVTVDTFDDLTYKLKIAPATGDNEYFVATVSGTPPQTRTPGKNEKPEDRKKLDQAFQDKLKKLEDRIRFEHGLAKWTYLVPKSYVASLLESRDEMLEAKPKK